MSIGLFDSDMVKYIQVPFNLELMKLSAYYKKKLEIVTMSPTFSPERYSKFIYRKDYYDGDFPKELYTYNNIEYGGRAFNPTHYVPLIEDIEKIRPDKYIYNKFEKIFATNIKMKKAWKTMYNAEHFRLSLDGKTIWNNFEKQIQITSQTNTLFLYDYNLNNIENSDIIIKELVDKLNKGVAAGGIGMKFPIEVDNSYDLLKWTKFKPTKSFFLMQYNGIIEDEALVEFIQQQKNSSLSRQLDYYFTINSTEQEIIQHFPQIYKQVIFLRENHQQVNLKYEKDFFSNKKWEQLIQLLNSFLNSGIKQKRKNSLYDFVNAFKEYTFFTKDIFSKQDARDIFTFVGQNNYELFKEFYECKQVTLKGGQFQNE